MRLWYFCLEREGSQPKIRYVVLFLLPLLYLQSLNVVSLYKKDQTWTEIYGSYVAVGHSEQATKTLSDETSGSVYENRHPYDSIPKWMTSYFQWHSQQLELIHDQNQDDGMNNQWRHHKVLLVRCMDDDRCGGTSDRLKSIPLFLILAAKTNRLVFLRWTRPFSLEEFLIPNDQRLDDVDDRNQYNYIWNWTVPNTLASILDAERDANGTYNQTTILSKKSQQLVSAVQNPSIWLVQGNLQFSGAALYESLAEEMMAKDEQESDTNASTAVSDFTTLYHYFFHATFAPAPAIRSIVDELFQRLHLQPNQFVVIHIRAKYPGEVFRETGNLTALEEIVDNAICIASNNLISSNINVSEAMPIYLAADAMPVLQAGMEHPNVVSRLSSSQQNAEENDPPHLNFAQKDEPSAFYSIFVDLIVMSQSRCVTFGAGGFGRFGSLRFGSDLDASAAKSVKQQSGSSNRCYPASKVQDHCTNTALSQRFLFVLILLHGGNIMSNAKKRPRSHQDEESITPSKRFHHHTGNPDLRSFEQDDDSSLDETEADALTSPAFLSKLPSSLLWHIFSFATHDQLVLQLSLIQQDEETESVFGLESSVETQTFLDNRSQSMLFDSFTVTTSALHKLRHRKPSSARRNFIAAYRRQN
ncbi:unnamed protein product [Cylindrotheca closterium]|uniref:Uncharacterized protein n=1 Tax=Cylindrotheca closterium TaxID=2856 RepID=A0AAD2CFS0_9STRA|nr:unnamed protein product [Cylindrotheca closterium]